MEAGVITFRTGELLFGLLCSSDDLYSPEWSPDVDVFVRPDTLMIVIRLGPPPLGSSISQCSFLAMSSTGFVWMLHSEAFNLL